MIFLAPLALLSLTLAALPVAIHLLVRRRAKRLDFPSLRYLRETPSFQLRPRRIQQPLLLALRIAALALLITELSRPLFLPNNLATQRMRFILLDASLSMKARGRAEAAKEQARNIINKLSAHDRAAVISFSSNATVLANVTTDRRKLLQAVENYSPGSSRADYAAGLAFAEELMQREPPGNVEIDIVSDFQRSGFNNQLPFSLHDAHARIQTFPVGTPIERNAFLLNETIAATARNVELSATEIVSDANGRSGARHSWTLDAMRGTRPGLDWETQANQQITGYLTALAPDDFDADDKRFFAFTPPRTRRVLLVTDVSEAATYLRPALEAATFDGDQRATPAPLDERRELPTNSVELEAYTHVVWTLRAAPRENELRSITDFARRGGIVWLWLARDTDTAAWSAAAQNDATHALPFTNLVSISATNLNFGAADQDALPMLLMSARSLDTLRAVRVRAGYIATPRADAVTLMRWSEGDAPAFVANRIGKGMMLLLATSPERAASDLGQSAALPTLSSAVLRAEEFLREPLSQTLGEPVRLSVLPETAIKVTNAEGHALMTQASALITMPLWIFPEPGIYRVEWANEAKFLAINAPVAESERALAGSSEIKRYFPDKEESAEEKNGGLWRDATERQSNVWRFFLAGAFLLLITELFVAGKLRTRSTASRNYL